MQYDFTSILDRRGKDAIAVDIPAAADASDPGSAYFAQAQLRPGFDQIPMWVADMNFPVVPTIQQAITERVAHPAFGYFAHMTGLGQAAIELGGREATPAHLAGIIRRAREHGVRVIFVQPQFNPASARALSQAIGGEVVGMDPLAADLPANIREMTRVLKHGFAAQKEKREADERR